MNRKMRGMTLLELTVVLAILAVVTSIAVASFTAVEDQSRFEGTVRQVENIEAAILGQPDLRTADNQQLINGFVADMGRMPTATIIDSEPAVPMELWVKKVSTEPYLLRPATAANISAAYELSALNPPQTLTAITNVTDVEDPTVFVGTGWRGPYLRLPVGADTLRDAWGNPFDLFKFDGSPVTLDGDAIFSLRSRGADYPSFGPAGGYSRDIEMSTVLPTERFRGDVTVQVKVASLAAQNEIVVQMFTPDGMDGKITCYKFKNNTQIPMNGKMTVIFPKTAILAGNNTTVTTAGPRVFRAYRSSEPVVPSASATIKSTPAVVTIPHNGLSNAIQLELP